MGVSDGVWECGKPKRFSPCGFAECVKRGVRNGGSARGSGTTAGALSGKE